MNTIVKRTMSDLIYDKESFIIDNRSDVKRFCQDDFGCEVPINWNCASRFSFGAAATLCHHNNAEYLRHILDCMLRLYKSRISSKILNCLLDLKDKCKSNNTVFFLSSIRIIDITYIQNFQNTIDLITYIENEI